MNFDPFKPLEGRDRARAEELRMQLADYVSWRERLRADYKDRMRVRRTRFPGSVRPWMVRYDG